MTVPSQPVVVGPRYTIPKPLQCLESQVTNVSSFLKNLAAASSME